MMRWIRQEQGHPQTWGSGLTIEWNVWASQPIWNNIRFYDVTVLDNGVDGCSHHSGHVGLTDNLIACRNESWIDWIAITHPEVTLPKSDRIPQRSKGLGTMITYYPTENSGLKMINHRPNPQLVLFPTKVFEFIKFPTWGSALGSNYPVSVLQIVQSSSKSSHAKSVTRLMPRTPCHWGTFSDITALCRHRHTALEIAVHNSRKCVLLRCPFLRIWVPWQSGHFMRLVLLLRLRSFSNMERH